MKKQSFSNRIAFNFMLATAVLIIVIFAVVYLVVHKTVETSLKDDLTTEGIEVAEGLVLLTDSIVFADEAEWQEKEHGQVEVNPIFIQVADSAGKVLRRSPNLMGTLLAIDKNETGDVYFNSSLSGVRIRQFQLLLKNGLGQQAGFVSVAIPLEESHMVLRNLFIILLTGFPVALVILYFITKFIAKKSISPVLVLTERAEKITRENLNERIPFPAIEDELHTLTGTINSLLDRMEDTLLREKQFASDASHELRTPLSVLKGTLEIMIRKPRPSAYYIEKAATCFSEVNRMSILVDQLLLLARYESKTVMANLSKVSLEQLVHRIIARNVNSLEEKNLTINLKIGENTMVITDAFMTEQILENIFSNAVKYSYPNQAIEIFTDRSDDQVFLTVKDEGVGMEKEELSKIFDRFYRADKSRSAQSKSHGLGLAIAKRFADLLQIKISVVSQPGKGSSFTLAFPSSVGLHHS
jgi:signal transduction histidine kinase